MSQCCDGHSLCAECQRVKEEELARYENNFRRVKRGPKGESFAAMFARLSAPSKKRTE